MQVATLDREFAALFEAYYQRVFARTMTADPHLHRVIPVGKTIRADYEIQPYESAAEIIENSRAWGVADCICRKQKALVGDPCDHPVDVCIWLSSVGGIFDNDPKVRVVSKEEALKTLERAADAGLIHSTANNQQNIRYICNCCTCSCGFLRGIADLGIANVMARSAFVCKVDAEVCLACEGCIEYCQFGALEMDGSSVSVDPQRCVGCGVCVRNCSEDALALVRRPESDIKPVPANEAVWGSERAANRGLTGNPPR
ncbi:MAG TPA: 4Fe-4S binding protein, partial [Phototrophicaceae bacterium]|nr:4Fe-4S binding protein [Phototrophicaceae bacterium]